MFNVCHCYWMLEFLPGSIKYLSIYLSIYLSTLLMQTYRSEQNTSSTKRLNIVLRLAGLLFKAVSPPKNQQRPLHREGKKAYSTWYSQAVSHPSTNQARPCLASEIRRDRACSEWYGRKRRQSRQTHYLYIFTGSVLILSFPFLSFPFFISVSGETLEHLNSFWGMPVFSESGCIPAFLSFRVITEIYKCSKAEEKPLS